MYIYRTWSPVIVNLEHFQLISFKEDVSMLTSVRSAPEVLEMPGISKEERRNLLRQARLVRVDGLQPFSREEPTKSFSTLAAEKAIWGHWLEGNGKVCFVTGDGEIWIGSRLASKELEATRDAVKRMFAVPKCSAMSCGHAATPFLLMPHQFSSHDLLKRFSEPDWMP